jgi:hypothetical protein
LISDSNYNTAIKSIRKYFLLKSDSKTENKILTINKGNNMNNRNNRNNTLKSFSESTFLANESYRIGDLNKKINGSIKLNTDNNISNNYNRNNYRKKRINLNINNNYYNPFYGIKTLNELLNNESNLTIKNSLNENNNKKRLILRDNYIFNNNIDNFNKEFEIGDQKLYNNKTNKLSYSHNHKSLQKLHKLNDDIGPNQYSSIIIPNTSRKINKRISEEKERALKTLKNMLKFQEIKMNKEYYSQKKNSNIEKSDDYYKKKDFDQIILSDEKKSKYSKIKKEIYNTAFKPFSYDS